MSAQGGNANAVNGASDAKFGINPFETAKGEYTPEEDGEWMCLNCQTTLDLSAHDADLTARLAAAEAEVARLKEAREKVSSAVDEARMLNQEMIAKGNREDDFPGAEQYWEGAVDAADWWFARVTLAFLSAYRPVAAHPERTEREKALDDHLGSAAWHNPEAEAEKWLAAHPEAEGND